MFLPFKKMICMMFIICFDTCFSTDIVWLLASMSAPSWNPDGSSCFMFFRYRLSDELSNVLFICRGTPPSPTPVTAFIQLQKNYQRALVTWFVTAGQTTQDFWMLGCRRTFFILTLTRWSCAGLCTFLRLRFTVLQQLTVSSCCAAAAAAAAIHP